MASSSLGTPNFFKKYLHATDFIEIQISGVRKRDETITEFRKLFFELIDLIDMAKAANMMLEKNYFEQFLAI